MRRVSILLSVLLLVAFVFVSTSCKGGGPLSGGQAGIVVGTASPGTKVYIDGRQFGTVRQGAYGPVAYVAPGQHRLSGVTPNGGTFEMVVYAFAGQATTYNLPLTTDITP